MQTWKIDLTQPGKDRVQPIEKVALTYTLAWVK